MMSNSGDDEHDPGETDATMQLSSDDLARLSTLHLADTAPDDGGVLLLLGGTYGERQYDVDKPKMILGRDPAAEILVDADGISRRHAKITQKEGRVFVEDLGSTNGTLVNNEKTSGVTRLVEDDLIQVGAAVFKYLPAGCQELSFLRAQEGAARTDPLTDVANKRCLLETLEMHFELSRRRSDLLAVIMLDIDHFKSINDTHGHDAGDEVLKSLARRLADGAVRNADTLGRYGGEEFVVILPGASLEQAQMVAERVRGVIEARVFTYEETDIPVTVSCGVAVLAPWHQTATRLLKSADGALYEAKESGRNRVCLASVDPPKD